MVWKNYKWVSLLLTIACLLGANACSVSYKLEGGSINYDLTKTIQIGSFPNRTPHYPELSQLFEQALRRRFVEQTRLTEVRNNPDIEIEGEITGYNIAGMAVKEDAYASLTKLTITVNIVYINNKESGKDVKQTFSAFKEFDSSLSLSNVQDELVSQIIDELIDMIYNATVANW